MAIFNSFIIELLVMFRMRYIEYPLGSLEEFGICTLSYPSNLFVCI